MKNNFLFVVLSLVFIATLQQPKYRHVKSFFNDKSFLRGVSFAHTYVITTGMDSILRSYRIDGTFPYEIGQSKDVSNGSPSFACHSDGQLLAVAISGKKLQLFNFSSGFFVF